MNKVFQNKKQTKAFYKRKFFWAGWLGGYGGKKIKNRKSEKIQKKKNNPRKKGPKNKQVLF